MIDSVGQVFREFRQELLPRNARLLLQFVKRVRPKVSWQRLPASGEVSGRDDHRSAEKAAGTL
jgi:hypothetical protein